MTPTTKYNVDYFIAKFTAIPEERWITGQYTDGEGNCCALGHCGMRTGMPKVEEANALMELFEDVRAQVHHINDGLNVSPLVCDQPTPRQRILAALQQIKEKQSNTPQL